MSTSGDTTSTSGRYDEYIRGCSVHGGYHYKSKAFMNLLPHMNHDIPRCTEHRPMYWTHIVHIHLYPLVFRNFTISKICRFNIVH